MATGPLRRHVRRKPRLGDRLFTRRFIPRDVLPISAPATVSWHALQRSFLPSNQYQHLSVNGTPSTWPCLSGANGDEGLRAHNLPILPPSPSIRHLFRPPPAQEEEKTRRCGAIESLERGVRSYRFPLHRGTTRAGDKVEHDPQERADLVCLVFFTSSTVHLISPLGSKTKGSRCGTHTVRQPQFEDPDRITRLAPITVDHRGLYRACRPCPCHSIEQAASVRTLTKPLTSLHLPPTLLTSRYHAHRSLSKERLDSIGLQVEIERISMTIMTVAVQDVIEYDAFSRRSILLVLWKTHPFALPNFSFLPAFTPICFAALHLFSAYLLLFVP